MFSAVAESLAKRLNVSAEALREKLITREKESSTVLQPGMAIPHIVIEGEHLFDIMLVRCREGVTFKEGQPPVQAVFILVGSPDERNYHLRALMAIGHIVQEPNFMQRWLTAPGAEHLRDILLLSTRKRDKE